MRPGLYRLVGADGCLTLVLSNLVIITTCGLSWFWQLRRIYRVARSDVAPAKAEMAVVLGFQLDNDRVRDEFARRLERARTLYLLGMTERILVVGGRTGSGRLSEAAAGSHYLVDRHVPEGAILTEEHSRHTLENLRHARASMEGNDHRAFLLITSRYHLARSISLAEGLGLRPIPCPAEDRLDHDLLTLLRLCHEAWFLHWYIVGRSWTRFIGARRSLARIT
ncbi:MAG: YdcF family protein [Rhodospirillales bacterium]